MHVYAERPRMLTAGEYEQTAVLAARSLVRISYKGPNRDKIHVPWGRATIPPWSSSHKDFAGPLSRLCSFMPLLVRTVQKMLHDQHMWM